MKISFLVTVHNEDEELSVLLEQLTYYKTNTNKECEIIVLDDYSNNPKTLDLFNVFGKHIKLEQHRLNNSFGKHKQYGNTKCSGDYIFQLDADEYLSQDFLDNLKSLLESNEEVDLYMVPRVNRIRGLTEQSANKWGWRLSLMDGLVEERYDLAKDEYELLKKNNLILKEDENYVLFRSVLINWPDYQFRLYRNSPNIKWERDLHELIVGAEKVANLPCEDYTWALFHDKSIERQESQNMFYMDNFSKELNVRR